MAPDQEIKLIEALRATAEIFGKALSLSAASMFLADLGEYDPDQVCMALSSCRRELKFFPTVSDVVTRIQALDGRPGPEEAWALLPKNQHDSAVISDEMASCLIFVNEDDLVASRMAFLEAYRKECVTARANKAKVRWFFSAGHDPGARAGAIALAVDKKRITLEHARELLPDFGMEAPSQKMLELAKQAALPMPKLL